VSPGVAGGNGRELKPDDLARFSVEYEVIVNTREEDRRFDLLHQNVRKYETISNSVAATKLEARSTHTPL
jgi:hypothetical protein